MSSSSNRISDRTNAASAASAADGPDFGFTPPRTSGGIRTACPGDNLSLVSTRLPSTRNSPLRTIRWIWLNGNFGKCASRKRSTRISASSAVTVIVWTPTEIVSTSAAASVFAVRGARGSDVTMNFVTGAASGPAFRATRDPARGLGVRGPGSALAAGGREPRGGGPRRSLRPLPADGRLAVMSKPSQYQDLPRGQ